MLTYANSGGQAYLSPVHSPRMRRVRGNSRGLSEIIGTLMLILIVVGAATALSVFVTGYEKQVLSQEATSHDKSLESYAIFGTNISTGTDANLAQVPAFYVFDIASTTVETSSVTSILINQEPVLWYCLLPFTSNPTPSGSCTALGGQWITFGEAVQYAPEAEYKIVVNYDDAFGFLNSCGYNSFNQSTMGSSSPCPDTVNTGTGVGNDWVGTPITATGFLRIQVYTAYNNVFVQSLSPPIAIANVSTLGQPDSSGVLVLDAEASSQPGGNDSILSWNWSVSQCLPSTPSCPSTGTGAAVPVWTANGEEVPLSYSSTCTPATSATSPGTCPPTTVLGGYTYAITLTVTDAVGLYSSDTIYWTAPTSS